MTSRFHHKSFSFFLAVWTTVQLLFAFQAEAAPKDIVLQVSVIDGSAFTESIEKVVGSYVIERLPNHRLMKVYVKKSSSTTDDLLREELREKIEKLNFDKGDQITHLILAAHGSTRKTETGSEETSMNVFDTFDSEKVSTKFDSIFNTIKNRFSNKTTIVLNSCSTLCGTDENAGKRAKTLLNYFGAPNGQVYGAYTQELFVPNKLSSKFDLKQWTEGKESILYLPLLAYALSGVYNMLALGPNESEFIKIALLGGAVFFRHIMHATRMYNQGRIFFFRNGNLTKVEPIRRYVDEIKIYNAKISGRSCKAIYK